MESSTIFCPIWGHGFTAKGYPIPSRALMVVEDSPRAGGGYEIGQIAQNTLRELDDSQRAMLTTMLIDLRSIGVGKPRVTPEMVEDAKHRRPLPIPERALRLLRYFAESSEDIGQQFTMGEGGTVDWGALAWSESENWPRAFKFAQYLQSKGWIELTDWGNTASVEVLVDGYSEVVEQATNADSSQAFVAMWFDDETDVAFECGIKPAIEEAGYKPVRIDRELNVDKIDDAIIAHIRKSRFLVADFTHGEKGPRGGVYYEAGFAHGLNIPVIFTCRRDMVRELHFDTRQFVHILWDMQSLENLHIELYNRIRARIGEGPELSRIE